MCFVGALRVSCLPFLAAMTAMTLPYTLLSSSVEAKIPGAVHCYNDICHRVRTVAETSARRGMVEPVIASFYDAPDKDRFNPSFETSSGTMFQPDADDNAASPIHPDGTVLLLWSPVTRGAAIVRVNNAGPYYPGRSLDVSHGVADRLGFTHGGVMQLLSVVISAPSEPDAHFVRGRVYPKVGGYLGKFENIALASFAAPVARESLFQGNTPLPAQALGTSEQILMNAAAEHFRMTELVRLFEAAPADVIAPPDRLSDDTPAATAEQTTPAVDRRADARQEALLLGTSGRLASATMFTSGEDDSAGRLDVR